MNERINELAVKHLTLTYNGTSNSLILDGLDKFVELIQAEEREACAKLCETNMFDDPLDLADEIRARGEVR